MNRSESKYFNTAVLMDEALLSLLAEKDFAYISVKEICARAGVNRSTFYLHYETLGNLLDECMQLMRRKFYEAFAGTRTARLKDIANCELEELVFITPGYLIPYLEFVKENRAVFRAAYARPETIGAPGMFAEFVRDVIDPVMARFQYPEWARKYYLSYYVNGLQGIVKEWLGSNCREDVSEIAGLMRKCILPDGNGVMPVAEVYRLGHAEN